MNALFLIISHLTEARRSCLFLGAARQAARTQPVLVDPRPPLTPAASPFFAAVGLEERHYEAREPPPPRSAPLCVANRRCSAKLESNRCARARLLLTQQRDQVLPLDVREEDHRNPALDRPIRERGFECQVRRVLLVHRLEKSSSVVPRG